MEQQKSLHEQLPVLFSNMTRKLGKTRGEILNHFSKTENRIEYDLSELIIRGYIFKSDAMLNIRFDTGSQSYEIENNVCRFSYMYPDSPEMIGVCTKYCDENFKYITDNTWLITHPDVKDQFFVLFLFADKDEEQKDRQYFKCTARQVFSLSGNF